MSNRLTSVLVSMTYKIVEYAAQEENDKNIVLGEAQVVILQTFSFTKYISEFMEHRAIV